MKEEQRQQQGDVHERYQVALLAQASLAQGSPGADHHSHRASLARPRPTTEAPAIAATRQTSPAFEAHGSATTHGLKQDLDAARHHLIRLMVGMSGEATLDPGQQTSM